MQLRGLARDGATAPMARDLSALHQRALAGLARLDAIVADPALLAARAPRISAWSVGDQVEHLLVVDGQVLRSLEKVASGTAEDRSGPGVSLVGRLALTSGWIPRGLGKAPERSRPRGRAAADLQEMAAGLVAGYGALAPHLAILAATPARFPHPVFGRLRAPEWLRFVDVHHRHHLKIVGDIRRAAGV